MNIKLLRSKMLFGFFLLFVTPVISQIKISITHHGKDDGSSKLTKKDSLLIKDFSIQNIGKRLSLKNKADIEFELINVDQLKQVCERSNYTWVFIQASWCGACINSLKNNRIVMDSMKNHGISLVVINQDILINQLQKKIFLEQYDILSYIIDPKIYGTNETKKQEKFIFELAGNKKVDDKSGGVPKNLFLNKEGELIYFDTTYKITCDLIKEKVFEK